MCVYVCVCLFVCVCVGLNVCTYYLAQLYTLTWFTRAPNYKQTVLH